MICSFVIKMRVNFLMLQNDDNDNSIVYNQVEFKWKAEEQVTRISHSFLSISYSPVWLSTWTDRHLWSTKPYQCVPTVKETKKKRLHSLVIDLISCSTYCYSAGEITNHEYRHSNVKFNFEIYIANIRAVVIDFDNQHTNIRRTTISSQWWLASPSLLFSMFMCMGMCPWIHI